MRLELLMEKLTNIFCAKSMSYHDVDQGFKLINRKNETIARVHSGWQKFFLRERGQLGEPHRSLAAGDESIANS
jgi:hypothetical protein